MAAPVLVMMVGRYVQRLMLVMIAEEMARRTRGGGTAARTAARTPTVTVSAPTVVANWDENAFKKLYKKLNRLKKGHNRLVATAMKAGLRITARAIKTEIPAYKPSRGAGSKLKEAKKAVGLTARLSKGGRSPVPKGQMAGKVGSNVGMKKRTSADRPGGSKGIGRGNLHWYLVGTAPRYHKSGHYTGLMRRTGIVQRAWGATQSLVMEKMKRNLAAGIMREAAKR